MLNFLKKQFTMETQIILRHVSPEIDALEIVSGVIIDGQFSPSDTLRDDLVDLGFDETDLNLFTESPIAPRRHFVTRSDLSTVVLELMSLPVFHDLVFYPNFIVFQYVS